MFHKYLCKLCHYYLVATILIAERGFTGASVGFISSLVPWASIPGALIFARLNDKTGATKN